MRKGAFALLAGILLLVVLVPITASAQGNQPEIPPPPVNGNYILDSLDWLSSDQEAEINAVVAKLDAEGLAEIAVVTLNDCGDDKQMFRNELFREWGIGHADDNDGLLIMVCWYDGDKSLRSLEQEVGYGLEGTIPDLLTSRVAKQYFVPAFSTGIDDAEVVWTGKAGDALVEMVRAYDGIIRNDMPAELQENTATNNDARTLILILVVVGLVLILVGLMYFLGGGSSGSSSSSSWPSSSSDSSSSSSPSFGGGSSGGGGSSTGF